MGNVYEWGTRYSNDSREPEIVLAGKNIQKVQASEDRIFALSKGGVLYSLPRAKADQQEGPKPEESTWIPFLSRTSPVSYRTLYVPLEYFDKYISFLRYIWLRYLQAIGLLILLLDLITFSFSLPTAEFTLLLPPTNIQIKASWEFQA